jgi:hypothetical protein
MWSSSSDGIIIRIIININGRCMNHLTSRVNIAIQMRRTHLQHDHHHPHRHHQQGNGKHPLSIDPTASSDLHRALPPGAPAAESSDNVPPAGENEGEGQAKWFQAVDERYLPLFSNATASRMFHARRARRSAANSTANLVHGGHRSSSNLNLDLHHNPTGSLSRLGGGGGGAGGGGRGGSESGESSTIHSPNESEDEGEPVELGVPLGLRRGGMDLNQRVERPPPRIPRVFSPRAGGHRGSGSSERLE